METDVVSGFGKRYIALVPIMAFDPSDDGPGYRQIRRDENGEPVISHHVVHHNERMYAKPGIARREAKLNRGGRVLEVDLDLLGSALANQDERHQHAEHMRMYWTSEHERLRAELDIVAPSDVDKRNHDYQARVRRTYALRTEAQLAVRRQLEAFRPPGWIVETIDETGYPYVVHDRLDPWVASIGDPIGDGAYNHRYFTRSTTEGGALAKLLAVILEGGGIFPWT